MLKSLSITNYTLIKNLFVDFAAGFNVITGETGAGKSIILGALGLTVGERADTNVLNDKTKKCIVEASFLLKNYSFEALFDEYDLDYEEVCILRREINPKGKSRAFINDSPVKLSTLKFFGNTFIDIHSQHKTLFLVNRDFQRVFLDNFADNNKLIDDYQAVYKAFSDIDKEISILKEQEEELRKEQDYLNFVFSELEQLDIKENEQKKIEEELLSLENAEEIKTNLIEFTSLNNNTEGLESIFSTMQKNLLISSKYLKNTEDLYARFNAIIIELEDIVKEVTNIEENIDFDTEKLNILKERNDIINNLLHKYRKENTKELLEYKDLIDSQLMQMSSMDEQIELLIEKREKLSKNLYIKAEKISKQRRIAAKLFSKNIINEFQGLALNKAQFIVDIQKNDVLDKWGCDKIVFKFSANSGVEVEEISKVASGGELSRLMLALKSIINTKSLLPTIVFDEIDAGISGHVAAQVSKVMQNMAKKGQLIVITHLPQVASKADKHFYIYKNEEKNNTETLIKILDIQDHIKRIASMISNNTISEAAIENAKELINS